MEYFLVVWKESSDEIHFMLMSMDDFDFVDGLVEKFSSFPKPKWDEVCDDMETVRSKSIDTYYTQTYCSEDWPFSDYKIKKMISLPEFGY